MSVEVQGKLQKGPDLGKSPGELRWTRVGRKDHGFTYWLTFVCPCGCSLLRTLRVRKGEALAEGRGSYTWGWDGNEDKPTLTPSVNCSRGCNWHGHLTKGVFRRCQ